MAVLLVGLIFLAAGIVGIWFWWLSILVVIQGSLPLIAVLFGLAAIAVGFSSIRDKAASAQEEEKKE